MPPAGWWAPHGELDLAGLRAPTLAADLAARDFTLNALALPLENLWDDDPLARLVDPTGGRADLAAGVLKPAGPGVLSDDPLRVLRAFRFMSTPRFHLGPRHGICLGRGRAGTLQGGVRTHRGGMAAPHGRSAGRAGGAGHGGLRGCSPAWRRSWPPGGGLAQNPYHHLDVLGHSLACVRAAGLLLAGRGPLAGALGAEGPAYLKEPRRRALFMTAALLHDLGKPPTRRAKDDEWATFYRHEMVGAKLAAARCRALGLSKADAAWVGNLVSEHMRPFHLLGAQGRGQLTRRGVRRMLAALGPDLPALFMLAMADTIAGRGPLRPPEAEA